MITPSEPHSSYAAEFIKSFKKIPKISHPICMSQFARANNVSLKKAKQEMQKRGYMQITKQYWIPTSEYEAVKGTPVEKALCLRPKRACSVLDKLRDFSGNPMGEDLRVSLGRQGFRDLVACGVLVPYRRFTVAKLIYFYPCR